MSNDFNSQYDAIQTLVQEGKPAEAAAEFDTIQKELLAARDLPGMVSCLTRRVRMLDDITLPALHDTLKSAAPKEQKILLDQIGLERTNIKPAEVLRRLQVLLDIKEGDPVLDRSWGFGVIRKIDSFFAKVTIDYDINPGHTMTFAAVAASLKVCPEEHILARNYRDRAAIERMAKENPGELLKLALRSWGNVPVGRLEDLLCNNAILGRDQWKHFWTEARKALRKDLLVDIPARRTEPIRLLTAQLAFDQDWLAELKKARDMRKIHKAITDYLDDLKTNGDQTSIPPDFAEVINDRIAFSLKGADNTDAPLYAAYIVLSKRARVQPLPDEDLRKQMIDEDRFLQAAEKLPATQLRALFAFLLADANAKTAIIASLPRLNLTTLGEVLGLLNDDPEARAAVARLLSQPEPVPTLLVWTLRNHENLSKDGWTLPTYMDLLQQALFVIEHRYAGEALRMRNILQEFFDSSAWLTKTWERLDSFQRRLLFERIQASEFWEPASHRVLVKRLISLSPALGKGKDHLSVKAATKRLTSWRSLAERKLAYEHLVTVEMPRNAADIAAARELGDLRENAEYQYAKDKQRELLTRQSKMDADLKLIQGTDFADVKTEQVAPGTAVSYTRPDGTICSYTILGEWDSNEQLGIISNKSRLAIGLLGKKVGEKGKVPSAAGEEEVTVTSIAPISDAVKEWIAGTPAPIKDEK